MFTLCGLVNGLSLDGPLAYYSYQVNINYSFLSSFYYQLPVFLRPLVLFFTRLSLFCFSMCDTYFLPLATLDSQAIPMMLLDRLDRHINMVDIIADTGGILGLCSYRCRNHMDRR